MRKYIVDNLANQTLSGDLTLSGNLRVDGGLIVTDGTYSISSYKALLTQTEVITGTDMSFFDYALIIGEEYTISNYVSGDDFSNIATVTSGTINQTGCVFIANGSYPTNFSNGSTIISSGTLVVEVLENNLGFNLSWVKTPFGGEGYYVAFHEDFGPVYNSFPRNKVMVSTQEKNNWNYMTTEQLQMWIQIYSLSFKDDSIILNVYDYGAVDYLSDRLYYTPVEIYLKQDLDTTPITITGTVSSSYPIVNTSINLLRDSQLITTFYSNLTSNDLSEVVTSLNTDPDTSHLGTYSIDNGNIVLTMQAGLKRKFVEENQLTFEVFND